MSGVFNFFLHLFTDPDEPEDLSGNPAPSPRVPENPGPSQGLPGSPNFVDSEVYYIISDDTRKDYTRVYKNGGEVSFFGKFLASTNALADGKAPTFDEMIAENYKAYIRFTRNPSIQFAKKVAGKLREGYDWRNLFENPNQAIIDYLNATKPINSNNPFTSLLAQAPVEQLVAAAAADIVGSIGATKSGEAAPALERVLTNIEEAQGKMSQLLGIVYALDQAQAHQNLIAREMLLTSIFHSKIVVFGDTFQGGIDEVMADLRSLCKVPAYVTDKELFTDLVKPDDTTVTLFANAVALSIIKSGRLAGLSTGVKKQVQINRLYVNAVGRMIKYRFNTQFIDSATAQLLVELRKRAKARANFNPI